MKDSAKKDSPIPEPGLPVKPPAFGRHLWRLLGFARPYTKRIGLGLVANAGARAFDLLPMVLVGHVVDAATGAGDIRATSGDFLFWGVLVLVTFLCLAVFQSVSDYALGSMAQSVRHDLRMKLYAHLQTLHTGYFEDRQTGDLMAVIAADVDNLERFFADVTTSVVRLFVTFLGVFGILLYLEWRLALLLFAPLPLALLAIRFFATRVQPQYRAARRAVGAINAVIENCLQGIGVIQAYTAEAEQETRVRAESADYRDAAINAARERAWFVPLIYGVAGLGFGALIAGGGYMTYADMGPSPGDYATFVLLATRLILPLFVFGMLINQIQRSEASAQRIIELLETEPAIADAADAHALGGPPERIEVRDVVFAYPNREPVLHGVSFTLERGKALGVVGPTGAGKSTLVKLLLRYFDPVDGEIRVDGTPLTELTLATYRSHLGYVSQEPFLFHGTVLENIRLADSGAPLEEVMRAAEVAGAAEFIKTLPQGYETVVGERGVKLSGGQRQRVSLARAVLRDPAVLILDEATASVDTRTEELIQTNLDRMRTGRMTLAVAHRLSTVRRCDHILVVVDGRVAEEGSHDQLIQRNGVYAGLWNIQQGGPAT